MIGGLHHQQKVDVLVDPGVVIEPPLPQQPQGKVPYDPLYLLGFLRKRVDVHDYPHHIIDLDGLEVELLQKFHGHLAHQMTVCPKILPDFCLGKERDGDGYLRVRRTPTLQLQVLANEESNLLWSQIFRHLFDGRTDLLLGLRVSLVKFDILDLCHDLPPLRAGQRSALLLLDRAGFI